MGAGASSAAGNSNVITLEAAAKLLGPVLDDAAIAQLTLTEDGKGVTKQELFQKFGVVLPFGEAMDSVMFDSDKSRGRCFVELKDTVRFFLNRSQRTLLLLLLVVVVMVLLLWFVILFVIM